MYLIFYKSAIHWKLSLIMFMINNVDLDVGDLDVTIIFAILRVLHPLEHQDLIEVDVFDHSCWQSWGSFYRRCNCYWWLMWIAPDKSETLFPDPNSLWNDKVDEDPPFVIDDCCERCLTNAQYGESSCKSQQAAILSLFTESNKFF